MSKMFYKGRIETRENHVKPGYSVKRHVKAGTEEAPISVVVPSLERKEDIEHIIAESGIVANITVDAEQEENTLELETLLQKPAPKVLDKKPNRNDPCLCGSGKKYKKCCG